MASSVEKSPPAGWYESGVRPGLRQWWDGQRWRDAFWPERVGLQPLTYAPDLARVDISSPGGPVFDIVGEAYREQQIIAALGYTPGLDREVVEMTSAELIPEPDNPHDSNAVAVRISGYTVGYISADEAIDIQPFIAGIVQRGVVPVVDARIWAVTRRTQRGPELKSAIRIALPRAIDVFPQNDPPGVPYTIVPRGRKTQVGGEEKHIDRLSGYISPAGPSHLLFAIEREDTPSRNGIRSVARVLLDGEKIGELSVATSKSALSLIDAQSARGLATVAWGQLTGSRVAAEVTLSLARAAEIEDEWLDGPPVVVSALPRTMTNPLPPAYAEPAVVPAAPAANKATWVWIVAAILALLLVAILYVGWVLSLGVLIGAFFLTRSIKSLPPRAAVGRW